MLRDRSGRDRPAQAVTVLFEARGKVVSGVAGLCGPAMRPCIALAGEVQVGARELRANGIESAYSLVETVGRDEAFARPDESLATMAARVARTWSRR